MRVTRDAHRRRYTDLDARRQRLRYPRLARPPAGRRGRASRPVQSTKHYRPERHRVQSRRPYRRTQRGGSAKIIHLRRDVQSPDRSRTNQRCGQGLQPLAHPRPRPRPRTNTSVPCAVSPSRRCNHQLRAGRRPWPREAQAMRWFL